MLVNKLKLLNSLRKRGFSKDSKLVMTVLYLAASKEYELITQILKLHASSSKVQINKPRNNYKTS